MAGSTPVAVGGDSDGSAPGSHTNHEEPAASEPNQTSSTLGKEKTPMCLVNELARYNKIEHQYRLTSEDGPPHKKKFTVTLKLGNEEYTAEGASIKKAQHAAAGIALKSTTYKHPPPKSSRQARGTKSNITPTVELNALAMKRGEPTVYTLVESPQFHHYNYHHRGIYSQPYNDHFSFAYGRGKPNFRGAFNNRIDPRYYGTGGKAPMYKVVVKVGEREFSGEGTSAQAARHDAASKALQLLHSLPLDDSCPANSTMCGGGGVAEQESELKSPISLVHEIALKRNLPVVFEVISEKGQPHMKTFVTRCCVGDKFETTGEGNGKKISKKRAAEKMLEQLRTLPPTTTVTAPGCASALARAKRKATTGKKKSRNIIKETPVQESKYDERESSDEMNPISRLIQIQQAKKEREPVYTLREERGLPRRREFIMEVTVGKHSFIGSGPNKKVAKRNAAEGLLQQLGYSSPTLNRSGHPIPSQQGQGQPPQQQHKVRFSDDKPEGGVSGRQLVPGLILMKDNKATNNGHKPGTGVNLKATIAKEYLNEGSSPTADALAGVKRQTKNSSVRPTEQLAYLASVLNFQVQFSDFPKGNHSEFLTLVSLDTDPPQVCHGAGATIELSHEQAALNALRSLSKVGLDSITPGKKEPTSGTTQQTPQPEPGLYIDLTIPKEESYVNGK